MRRNKSANGSLSNIQETLVLPPKASSLTPSRHSSALLTPQLTRRQEAALDLERIYLGRPVFLNALKDTMPLMEFSSRRPVPLLSCMTQMQHILLGTQMLVELSLVIRCWQTLS